MKDKLSKILFFLLLATCSSCSSIYRFSIEIQEPAAVTLPVSAQNVLILNNTVAQPVNEGIEIRLNSKPIRTNYPLELDSMVWLAVDEIAGVLNESNFFNTIAIYREPLRTDTAWLSRINLSPELQSDFYDTDNYDALLVVDRLLFSLEENATKIQSSESTASFIELRAYGIITCSMYLYDRKNPLTTFSVSDSLIAKSLDANDSIAIFKEIPEYVLHELSYMLGNRAAKNFIPIWKTGERLLFANYNSRMQEAVGYAANQRWATAESIWTTEYEKKQKSTDKSKLAFNLAVANEMQDKFDLALEWAQRAKEYMINADSDNNTQEMALMDNYISELKRRIQNNRLLDLQWGKE